jgi:hypothetical protein
MLAHRVIWVVALGSALASAGWAARTGADVLAATTARRTMSTPEQRRQLEILRDDIDKRTDDALSRQVAEISAKYLDGALPETPVIWEPRLAEVGALGAEKFTLEGMFGHIGQRSMILLNPDLRPDARAIERALCHEIVHAYLFSRGEDSAGHGSSFQTLLRRMAEGGAFEGIVADAADRTSLRLWLDAESARLADESAALERLHSELETERRALEQPGRVTDATSASALEGYTNRVEAANGRVERYNDARATFDREVHRYNLMLVYPDGRDETR